MNYGDYLTRASRFFGERVAVVDGDRSITYAELEDRSLRLASGMAGLGMNAGDRVADLSFNRLEMIEIDFGLALAGLVRVSINPTVPLAQAQQILVDSGARALLVGPHFEAATESLLRDVDTLELVVGPHTSPHRYDELIGAPADKLGKIKRPHESDILALRYTGGTTGAAKAVVRTHGQQIHVASGILLDLCDLQPDHRMLHATPLSHGASPYILPLAMRGGSQVILEQFDAAEALRLVDSFGVTHTKIVPPAMMVELVNARRGAGASLDLSSLELVIYGSAAMPLAVLTEAVEVFGPIFAQTYGLTEAPVTIAHIPNETHRRLLADDPARLAAAGTAYTLTDVAVAGPDGSIGSSRSGSLGEVLVRGPMVTDGYWGDAPESPKLEKDPDGWLHSGDMGYLDDEGYLFLAGRISECCVIEGTYVFPREIEEVVYAHPGVQDAAVCTVADAAGGVELVCGVTRQPGSDVTEEELLSLCRRDLESVKQPKVLRIVDSLPKSPTGKILRREVPRLVAAATSGTASEAV